MIPISDTTQSCWRRDGSRRYSDSEGKTIGDGQSDLVVRNFFSGDVYGLSRWEFNITASTFLDSLLADAREHGVETVVITPPYLKGVYEQLLKLQEFNKIIPQYVEAVQNLRADKVCNAVDPALTGCIESQFYDGMHASEDCAKRVLSLCLQGTGAFSAVQKAR